MDKSERARQIMADHERSRYEAERRSAGLTEADISANNLEETHHRRMVDIQRVYDWETRQATDLAEINGLEDVDVKAARRLLAQDRGSYGSMIRLPSASMSDTTPIRAAPHSEILMGDVPADEQLQYVTGYMSGSFDETPINPLRQADAYAAGQELRRTQEHLAETGGTEPDQSAQVLVKADNGSQSERTVRDIRPALTGERTFVGSVAHADDPEFIRTGQRSSGSERVTFSTAQVFSYKDGIVDYDVWMDSRFDTGGEDEPPSSQKFWPDT